MTSNTKQRREQSMSRRAMLGTLACGVGVVATSGAAVAGLQDPYDEGEAPVRSLQWVAWDDGYDYPIRETDEDGNWIIVEDEDRHDSREWAIDPTGWVYDTGTWYPIADVDADGIWYDDGNGLEWLLEN